MGCGNSHATDIVEEAPEVSKEEIA